MRQLDLALEIDKLDAERERANVALLLDEEIDRRVLDALQRNSWVFDDLVFNMLERHVNNSRLQNLISGTLKIRKV